MTTNTARKEYKNDASQPAFVGRERELGELKAYLDKAIDNKGNTVFICGEAGIGKTRLVEELISYAKTKNFKLLRGWCQKEPLAPYMPFNEALKSAGLEYLTAETPPPKVDCVYLVNKAGLLLAKYERKEAPFDAEIFTAMLIAVGSFVKDSMRRFEGERGAGGGLNRLDYQNRTILINRGMYVSLVAIMAGEPNEFLKDDMDAIVSSIEKNYGEVLKHWDGDMDRIKDADQFIEPLITSGKYDGVDYAKELQDPKLKMDKLYDNVLSGLIRESKKQPLLIFIDDLQWADTATLGILHYLARNIRTAAVMLVGTYRPEDTVQTCDGKPHPLVETMQLMGREDLLQEIELTRLTKEVTVELLNAHFERVRLPSEFFDRLYRETEGNPLFTLEVFKLLADEKVIEYDTVTATYCLRADVEIEKIKIPDKVHDVITSRLNRLEKQHRELLDLAAVEGEYFHAETIERVVGLDGLKVLRSLNTIEQMHKLIRSLKDRFKFDHVKIREVIYNGLSPPLRKEYHKLVGQCIEEQNKDNLSAVVTDLATHYYLAEVVEKAIPYLMQAGKHAKESYANKDAFRFYQNALEFIDKKCATSVPSGEQSLECLVSLGDIYALTGEYNIGLEYYSRALTVADTTNDKLKIAELNRKIGETYERKGEYDSALVYYHRALDLLLIPGPYTDDSEIGKVYNRIGWTEYKKGEYDKSIEHCMKGSSFAEKNKDNKEIGTAYHIIGTCYIDMGEYDTALEFLNKGLELRLEIGDLPGVSASYNNLGTVHAMRGNRRDALDYYKKSLQIMEKIGDPYGTATSYNNIGIVYAKSGEIDSAGEYFRKSLKIREKIGDSHGTAMSYYNIGRLYADKNEWTTTIELLGRSVRICEKTGEKLLLVYNYWGLCDAYVEIGDLRKGLDFGLKGLEISTEIGAKDGIAMCSKAVGKCYSLLHDWEKSIDHYNKALSLYNELGDKANAGDIHYSLGLIYARLKNCGKFVDAKRHFEECIRIFQEIGQEVELAKCYYEYGLMWHAKGDVDNAKKHLQNALEIFEIRNMAKWVEKVKEAITNCNNPYRR